MSNLSYRGYTASVDVDAQAEVFNGRVAGLRDVIHFRGASFHELNQALRTAIDDYLQWCEEVGQEPEKPYSGRILVRMDSELHRSVARYADKQGRSINQVMLDAVGSHLQSASGHPKEKELS